MQLKIRIQLLNSSFISSENKAKKLSYENLHEITLRVADSIIRAHSSLASDLQISYEHLNEFISGVNLKSGRQNFIEIDNILSSINSDRIDSFLQELYKRRFDDLVAIEYVQGTFFELHKIQALKKQADRFVF